MRFKGTLVLLIVCLALGGYVYFYEIKGGEQREKAKEAENQIWKFDSKNVQQIDLNSEGQHIAAIRKDEKDWILTSPRRLDADSEELDRLVNAASKLRRESVVEQNASNLTKFGLNPAQSGFKLRTKDGKEYAISFGNNNPTGSSTYALLQNQKEVFLVTNQAASAFSKKVEDLRNRSILGFDQSEVQSLSVKSSKGIIELYKDGDDRWWFAGSEKRAADSPEVRGILNALSLEKIKEFFDEDIQDNAKLGIDKPFIDIRLTLGKNKAIKHLLVGFEKSKLTKNAAGKSGATGTNLSSSEIYLAKDESRSDLFFVDKSFIDKVFRSPDAVRDKALASFQRWNVDSIELTNPKGSFRFTKSGGEWFLGEAKKKARWDSINGILDALEKPVKAWIDKPSALSTYGLDKPVIHVILKQGSNTIADCSLGKAAKDGIYAQLKGDASIKIADPDGLNVLDTGESDFIESPPAGTSKK
jgi:hypothetical protein